MIAKRSTPSGRAKAGQGDSVAQIKHISRANVDGYGGTPPNLKVAKNPVKSNFTGLNTGTGNKAARRAAALKKEEFVGEARKPGESPQDYADRMKKKHSGGKAKVYDPMKDKSFDHDQAEKTRGQSGKFSKEELDMIASSMIDEGYDLSDYTWETFHTLCVEASMVDEGLIDAAKAGSERHQAAMKGASRAIKKANIRARKLGKALKPAVDTARSAASGVAKAAKSTYEAGQKTGTFAKKGAQRHNDMVKAAKKVFSKEELQLDQIVESLIERGHTEQEAYALVAQFTLDEAITSEKGKAKAAEMIAKRSTPSGRAKAGQGDSVAQIKHISRANVDNLGGTPPNPKIARNPVKSRSYGGTGNKAARRAGLTPTREKPNAWKEEYVDEAQSARNNPEKYEREQSKKYAPVRGEKTPMPPRGDKRREDFERWYRQNVR
jgi:hypothetical protein